MIWQFTIIDSSNVSTIIDEPVGFTEMSYSWQRNLNHHGIFKTINTGSLKYIEEAYTILRDEYVLNGANGTAQLKIEYKCSQTDDFAIFFEGKFDFNTYGRFCGKYCYIECEVITTNCIDTFMSSIDTNIDFDATTSLTGDTITALSSEEMVIAGQEILLRNKASVDVGGATCDNTICLSETWAISDFFIPVYFPLTSINDFGEFNANNSNCAVIMKNGGYDDIVFPMSQADVDDYYNFMYLFKPVISPNQLNCLGGIELNMRIKGGIVVHPQITIECSVFLFVEVVNPLTTFRNTLHFVSIGAELRTITGGDFDSTDFDFAWTDNIVQLNEGEYIHCYFKIETTVSPLGLDPCKYLQLGVVMDELSAFRMDNLSNCPATTTKSYLLNEVFNWIPNAINNCFEAICDASCFDAYNITNGLMIRNVISPVVPKLFLSWSDLFKNISKIFNIGWGFSNNETQLLISDIETFYNDAITIDLGSINEVSFEHAKNLTYGLINVGYSKWEAEEYSGLDEMNTTRQYIRNVNSNNTQLDLVSNFITAGYTIEITRRKNMLLTGTSDWRYDNDIFLINAVTIDSVRYVRNGGITSPENIVSPTTRINYRLTPIRTLLNWLKSIAAPTPDYTNEQLIFTSGTGNYIAKGGYYYDCYLENQPIQENEIIDSILLNDTLNAKPIWKSEYAQFTAPLSIAQKELIDTTPYSLFSFSCKNNEYLGYLVQCTYTPEKHTATFKILLKNE